MLGLVLNAACTTSVNLHSNPGFEGGGRWLALRGSYPASAIREIQGALTPKSGIIFLF